MALLHSSAEGSTDHVDRREEHGLVCRFLEAQFKGDLEALAGLLAPDFVDHGLLPVEEGWEQEDDITLLTLGRSVARG